MALIYKGKIINVKTEKIKFRDGHTSLYEFVLHRPAVAVVPVIDKDKIILVNQYRPVVKKKMWEIPAGFIDKKETPAHAAERELEEETGFKAGKLVRIGSFYSSPGFTDELTTIFLADSLTKTAQKLDKDETINVKIFSIMELMAKINKGWISDSKTVLGILWASEFFNGQ